MPRKKKKVYKWYPLGLQHYATVYLIGVYLIRSHKIVCLSTTSAISNLYPGETGNYLCDTAKSGDDIPQWKPFWILSAKCVCHFGLSCIKYHYDLVGSYVTLFSIRCTVLEISTILNFGGHFVFWQIVHYHFWWSCICYVPLRTFGPKIQSFLALDASLSKYWQFFILDEAVDSLWPHGPKMYSCLEITMGSPHKFIRAYPWESHDLF